VRLCVHPECLWCTDPVPGVREYLISPLFVSTFDTNQYIRQRQARSTGARVSEEPLPPPTFGEMRFVQVPDTTASGAIAGALLTSWKCEPLPQSGVLFSSLKFLTSWIPPCSPRSGHLCSFVCYPSADRERIQRAADKTCLKEADTKPGSPKGRKFTLRILDTTLVQVDRLSTCRTR